jgi:hypothetical protein
LAVVTAPVLVLGGGGGSTITVTVAEGDKFYYSLKTGKQVDENTIASDGWDIGFQRPRAIITNSGATAANLKSGGKGSVWYTEKTDFDSVVQKDAVTSGALSEYFTDTQKYIYSMSTLQHNTYNVINFPGFKEGNGIENTPFKTMLYDQKQFYKGGDGYPVTKTVYIVKHGDGNGYSKIQVSRYEYANKTDIYVVKYQQF